MRSVQSCWQSKTVGVDNLFSFNAFYSALTLPNKQHKFDLFISKACSITVVTASEIEFCEKRSQRNTSKKGCVMKNINVKHILSHHKNKHIFTK